MIILFILLLVLVVGVAIVLFPYVAHYKPEITQKISETLKRPILIGQIKAYWSGLRPWIELNDFAIYDDYHHAKSLQIKKIKLSVGIFSILLHRQVIPRDLVIEGSQLFIRQLADNSITINDIPIPSRPSNNQSNNLAYFKNINYHISNVDLIWQKENEMTLSFHDITASHAHHITRMHSKKLIVELPNFLLKPLIFDTSSADLNFSQNAEGSRVALTNIQLKNPIITLQGKINYNLSSTQSDKHNIELLIDYSFDQIDQVQEYISKNILLHWKKLGFITGNNIHGQIFIKGPLNEFPFQEPNGLIRASIHINDINFNLLNGKPFLQHLNGELFLDYPNLKTSGLTVQWLGKPITININTKTINDIYNNLNIDVSGILPITELGQIKNFQFLEKIAQGSAPFKAHWRFSKQNQNIQNSFSFDSDLKGLKLTLPEPFKKETTEINPMHVDMITSTNQINISGNYDKKLSVALLLEESPKHIWTVQSGDILFGALNASIQDRKNIVVRGNIPRLDLADLIQYFSFNEPLTSNNKININNIDINFENLYIAGIPLQKTKIEAKSINNTWSVRIKNRDVTGQIIIPENFTTRPLRIEFKHFALSSSTLKQMEKNGSEKMSIRPNQIPSLNIIFNNFYYDKNNLGRIHIVTSHSNNTLLLNKFTVTNPTVSLSISGRWDGNGTQNSSIRGHVSTSDFGDFLKDWEITNSLEGSEGTLDFKLNWPGPIYKVNLNKLNGNIAFKLKNGVILDVVSSKLDLVGNILNLVSINSLEFLLSKPFGSIAPKRKGFDFDIEEDTIDIINGNLQTDSFHLQGKLADVKAQGRIGLANQDYNLYVSITPFLTAFLPTNLAFGSGTILKGIVKISDKLIGGILNRFFIQTYHVTGPWSHPNHEKVSNLPESNHKKNSICQQRVSNQARPQCSPPNRENICY